MMARGDDAALIGAVDASCTWEGLETLMAMTAQLIKPVTADPMDHIERAYHSFMYGYPRVRKRFFERRLEV